MKSDQNKDKTYEIHERMIVNKVSIKLMDKFKPLTSVGIENGMDIADSS